MLKRDPCVKHGSIRTTQFNRYVGTAHHFRPQRTGHDDQTPSSDLEQVFDLCEALHPVLPNVEMTGDQEQKRATRADHLGVRVDCLVVPGRKDAGTRSQTKQAVPAPLQRL